MKTMTPIQRIHKSNLEAEQRQKKRVRERRRWRGGHSSPWESLQTRDLPDEDRWTPHKPKIGAFPEGRNYWAWRPIEGLPQLRIGYTHEIYCRRLHDPMHPVPVKCGHRLRWGGPRNYPGLWAAEVWGRWFFGPTPKSAAMKAENHVRRLSEMLFRKSEVRS